MDFGEPFLSETPEVKSDCSANRRHSVIGVTLHIEAVLKEIQTGGYSQITLKKGLVASQIENRIRGEFVGLNW